MSPPIFKKKLLTYNIYSNIIAVSLSSQYIGGAPCFKLLNHQPTDVQNASAQHQALFIKTSLKIGDGACAESRFCTVTTATSIFQEPFKENLSFVTVAGIQYLIPP